MHDQVTKDSFLKNFPILAPSFCQPDSAPKLGSITSWVNKGNMHSYPGGREPSYGLSGFISYAKYNSGSEPITATETGYNNLVGSAYGISEHAAAKYFPRLHFEYFNYEIERTYGYELLDLYDDSTPLDHYGLIRNDWSYKPAAIALKNLFVILTDTLSAWSPGNLDFDFKGNLTFIHWTLLEKKDQNFYLSIWQEIDSFDVETGKDITNPSIPLTVVLNQNGFISAQLYRPSNSTIAVANFTDLKNIQLQVPDEVIILRFVYKDNGLKT